MRKSLLVMFVLLLLGSPALADEFFVTGQRNEQVCGLAIGGCSQINFALFITAVPKTGVIPFGVLYDVSSLVGTVDGEFPIFGDGPGTLTTEFGFPGGKPAPLGVPYILDGFQGTFEWNDVGPLAPTAFMSWLPGQNSPPLDLEGVVTWNVINITPEPSTLFSLAIGVLALFGLAITRRRKGLNPTGEIR